MIPCNDPYDLSQTKYQAASDVLNRCVYGTAHGEN